MTLCLPDAFIFVYSFRQYVMSVAVETRGNLRRNERKYKKKAEKQWKGNILENGGTAYHKVFCLQFCYVRGKGAGASAGR